MQVTPSNRFRPGLEELQAQARILRTIGEAKRQIGVQPSPLLHYKNDCGGRIGDCAYFKLGFSKRAGFSSSIGMMESIMWDVAVILKMTANFVPTGLVRLNFIKNAQGEFLESLNRQGNVFASIQPVQQGKKVALDDVVPDEEYAVFLMYSLILGQYDHHCDNIFIAPSLQMMNFDNSLAFSLENGIQHLWGATYMCPVRPSFLCMKNGGKPLTFAIKQRCRSLLSGAKRDMAELGPYFNSFTAKKKLSYLPPGWLIPKKAINAALQRIQRLEDALDSPNVRTFRDLVLTAFESYRMSIAAVILCDQYITKEMVFKKDGLDVVKVVSKIVEEGYPFSDFQSILMGFTNYDEMFERLRKLQPIGGDKSEGRAYLESLKKTASLECKGDYDFAVRQLANKLKPKLERLGVFTNGTGENVIPFQGDNYPVDVTTFPNRIIIKAFRGELPASKKEELDKGLEVFNFLKAIDEEKIPFRLVLPKDREKTLYALAPYSYYVEQVSGSEASRFSIVYRVDANPRIIPLKVLDVQVLKLLLPPLVKPKVKVETVVLDEINYEAKVDYLDRLIISVSDGELPPMTRAEFAAWEKGPKEELHILETFSQFNVKCLYEEQISYELVDLKEPLLVQIRDRPTLQFKLLIKDKGFANVYDVKIDRRPGKSGKLKEYFMLTDGTGMKQTLSYGKFYRMVNF